ARHSRRCAHDDRWGRLSMNGQMYRREFLRRSALAAASAAIFACSPTATTTSASASLKPVKGGTLTWGQWDKIDVIDPALTTGAAAGEIAQNILDTLITMDSDQKFYPALASKWTIADSSKTFTFSLRDGVKFHDGSTLTSAAVKGSFDRILDPKTKAGAVVSLVGFIDEIPEADYARLKDDKRFRFVMSPRASHTLGFSMNVSRSPTDDRAVREAVNWAVDRKSIVDRIFFGVHHVSVGPLSEGVWAR